ncbi:murein L,D-transpeptidase catalytic domain-containing protein [Pseudoxanthomonas kaohsiungensis]|uniref:Murein L,D-transpeptidase catalytic domain-containing protein n=1 Tax=Pseudoxanthomonas kaohsiungensis TaxID=283923 RepID=A0ABW3LQR8_9GAMM|nr:murein L,D-transpeptidase catalytic domain family protein [Pseudoxanthomonas kaohsiungensis]KAF1704285.1 hypothetical protein CSC66_05435 [Pseudoxanthomonas kaohsiungensis]
MIARAALIAALSVGGYAQAAVPQHIEGMSRTTRAHAEQALECSRKLGRDPTLLIVADMRLPSSAQRLWAIDPRTSEVVLRTEVAHGRGSDPDRSGRASVFSNTPGSLMTSVGLYAVSEAYQNTRDGSTRRRLDGLMVGFNDAARERAVVLHPASYVRSGWAGHSEGCPAVSYAVMDQLNERGLDNAIIWIEGDQAGLSQAIASCSGSKVRNRFRWPWQKLPIRPEWKPDVSDAVNPMFEIQAEGFCPVRSDLVWFSREEPLYASLAGGRWPLEKWH